MSSDSTDDGRSWLGYLSYTGWAVGVLLLLGAVGSFGSGGVLGGIIWFITGLVAIPPSRRFLFELVSNEDRDLTGLGTGAVVIIVTIGFVAGGVAMPAGDTGDGASTTAATTTTTTVPTTTATTVEPTTTVVTTTTTVTPTPTATPTPTPTPTPTATPTPTPTPTTTAVEDTYSVRVIYEGDWQGALSVTGGGSSSTRSISGTGSRTITIDGPVSIISVNAQKQDASNAELTVQIIENGDVVAESSTSADYGMAQVSESFF